MISMGHIHTIVGIIGNIISLGLFLSPLLTFLTIYKKKAVEEFSSVPYLATLLNCMMWMIYGMLFVHPNSLLMVTVNGIGFVIEVLYIVTFLAFAPRDRQNHDKRAIIVGSLCAISGTAMYASPMSIMTMVIETKSVKYMPFSLALFSFLNGVCWTIYSLLRFDVFILVSNAHGVLLAVNQLILHGMYYRTTPKDDDQPLSLDKNLLLFLREKQGLLFGSEV